MVELPDGTKFQEIAAIAQFLGTVYPDSMIGVKTPSDVGISSMLAVKWAEVYTQYNNPPNGVTIYTKTIWIKDMTPGFKKNDETN
mmetsp:Transcript_15779/g.27635  ORF Transcript_15779/g.27635 Transcript_15779/m.27635 type:complete len:85 (-) Transcript_15779:108-362(-)